jgi:hypothetical protein
MASLQRFLYHKITLIKIKQYSRKSLIQDNFFEKREANQRISSNRVNTVNVGVEAAAAVEDNNARFLIYRQFKS